MNNNLDKQKYSDVIGTLKTAEKKNGLISSISDAVKRNLFRVLGPVAFIAAMTGAPGKAKAAISDCANKDCLISLEENRVAFYDAATCAFEGSIADGSGDGVIDANSGKVMIDRFNNTDLDVIDVTSETSCSAVVGPQHAIVLNGNTFVASGGSASVKKLDANCSIVDSATTGAGPSGITTDGTFLYTTNAIDGNITQIDPGTMDSTTIDIGCSFMDELSDVVYDAGTNALYISSMSESLMKIALPSYTKTTFQSLPSGTIKNTINSSYIITESGVGSDAYAVPISNPSSYSTLSIIGPTGVAANDTVIYVSNGLGVEKFDTNGNPLGACTSVSTRDIALLKGTPSTDICDGAEITGSEACDGTLLNGQDCVSQGFDGGTLACASDCATFDTSACTTETCGDGTTNGTDVCDGSDLNGNDCTTIGQGFIAGTLACNTDCNSYDTTSCVTQECGDGNINGTEACDGTNVNGETCVTLGYASGDLSCAPGCDSLNTAGCVPEADCGNGAIDTGEACDGTNLNGTTCETLGYASGDLACADSCAEFDETGCENAPDPVCGNDITEAGEDCDDGNTIDGDGCSATCAVEACEFTDDTELTIESAEDTQQVDTNQLVGILLDRYNGNLEDLQRECKVECVTHHITGAPVMQITTPDGSYCNFKLITETVGHEDYNEQIYQLYDIDTGDGEGAAIAFQIEHSYNNALDAGGLMLVHTGRPVATNLVSALGGGTLGTIAAYELHAEHEGVQAEWAKLIIGEGGIRFSHPDTPDEYRDVYFDNDTEGADPVVIWFNLTEFKKSRNLDEHLFPTDIRDPKEPDCGCSTPGSQNSKAPTGVMALSFLLATGFAAWRKKQSGEIVDDDEDNEVGE